MLLMEWNGTEPFETVSHREQHECQWWPKLSKSGVVTPHRKEGAANTTACQAMHHQACRFPSCLIPQSPFKHHAQLLFSLHSGQSHNRIC